MSYYHYYYYYYHYYYGIGGGGLGSRPGGDLLGTAINYIIYYTYYL